ncbi:MAG: YHS domain-containing protein [Nitrospirota bacterium]
MIDTKDPVCGMTVKVKDSIFTSSYKGVSYYFCAEKCKSDFDKDPEAVLAMKAAREKTIESERSTSLEIMIDEMSHEVRNPLTSIGGFARKVYKRLPHDDPNKEYMEMIIGDVDRLENIIGQLIKLTTIGISHSEPSNVNNIINDALKSFEKELENKKIYVELEIMDKPPLVPLDSNRIITVITNIIKNAVEAIEAGGNTHRLLKISSRAGDENMEFLSINITSTLTFLPAFSLISVFYKK